MPANLTPEYYEAERRFRQAKSLPERIEALEDMLSVMPKHKGTDRLRAELRTRLARLNQELEQQPRSGGRGLAYYIRKEGAGQVVLVGLPNTGKSQLLVALTGASPKVADYPFTTRSPLPGMMPFENISIQLVDTPAITDREARPWFRSLLRRADLLLIVVDLGQEPEAQVEQSLAELFALRVDLSGGRALRALLVGNKADRLGAEENLRRLEAAYGGRFPILTVSAATGRGLEELKREVFQALNIVRVYTKAPGRPADLTEPVILRRGDTIEQVAISIHKDLARRLKYAEVWGSGRFQGQRVPRHYPLQDGDIVELHA